MLCHARWQRLQDCTNIDTKYRVWESDHSCSSIDRALNALSKGCRFSPYLWQVDFSYALIYIYVIITMIYIWLKYTGNVLYTFLRVTVY